MNKDSDPFRSADAAAALILAAPDVATFEHRGVTMRFVPNATEVQKGMVASTHVGVRLFWISGHPQGGVTLSTRVYRKDGFEPEAILKKLKADLAKEGYVITNQEMMRDMEDKSDKTIAPELGDLVRDKLTGFKGIVTGMHSWLTGCQTATVTPEGLHDAKPIPSGSFDAPRLKILKKRALILESTAPDDPNRTGGPKAVVSRDDAR